MKSLFVYLRVIREHPIIHTNLQIWTTSMCKLTSWELQSCKTFRGVLRLLESCKVAKLLQGHWDYESCKVSILLEGTQIMESCKVAKLSGVESDYGKLQSCKTLRGALRLLESCKVAMLLEGYWDYGELQSCETFRGVLRLWRVAKLRNF